ncbi:SRPBCC family protein [Actinoplanes sp. N902-109]|uniref:SRPBCC family protein n=1 Tax=Actinoplanes sp. (strain N902-109) TaxID=649831 RepID=UPI0003296178|nr:SRPBCC family protein [Actinoplanes sp. N902-109]AGL17803.1 polyketide cyclase/dehydrase [Actinoplanes sp. N902-109]
MASESRHIAVPVDRPPAEVYAYAADPAHLPQWAPGLGTGVEQEGGVWWVQTPGGRARLDPAPPNEYLVLDHDVTLPDGLRVHNPMRVLPLDDGSEVVFTLRRQPGMDDDAWEQDALAVTADLARLKQILEQTA